MLFVLGPDTVFATASSISDLGAHLWDSLSHTNTHTIIAKSCIAPADISERSHLSLFDHCVLTLDCFSCFGLISACLFTILPALIICSCLSSDIPLTVTDHSLYDCVKKGLIFLLSYKANLQDWAVLNQIKSNHKYCHIATAHVPW